MNKWKIGTPDIDKVKELTKNTGFPEFICRVLVSRGIETRDQADSFFNADTLSDPMLIADMEKAVNTINSAVESGEKITVYGDYDCDGITSTYMLTSYLEALGADVSWYIPERDEGYGLNNNAIDHINKQGTKLIITVDNGISAVNEAAYIYELGMKLVITDHHEVPLLMPEAEAVVNPHRPDDSSPCKELAGCGVALKLIMALEGEQESIFEQFADIAAIGTVGDIVPLRGENRIIVRRGLENMERTENMGLLQLLKQSGAREGEDISSTFLAFGICPRINAAGRYGSPREAMELLLCNDMSAAAQKARNLCELNDLRKKAEEDIFRDAEQLIRENPSLAEKPVLILDKEGWKHGVIGLASTRLLHKYSKPNIIITNEGETSRGSARSTEDLPICSVLSACSDLLLHFGGHTKAAGFSIATEKIPKFRQAVYEYCDKHLKTSAAPEINADMQIMPSELTLANAQLAGKLEPFGEENQMPVFLVTEAEIVSKKAIKDGKYVSFSFRYGGTEFRAVYFGSSFADFSFSPGDKTDILVNLNENEYNDKLSLSIIVKDIRFAGTRQDRYFAAKKAYEDYRGGKVDKKLLCRMIPETGELRQVYDILRKTQYISKAELAADRAGINYCKLHIILDVFGEFSLIETDITADSVKLVPSAPKADLTKSGILADLRKMSADN